MAQETQKYPDHRVVRHFSRQLPEGNPGFRVNWGMLNRFRTSPALNASLALLLYGSWAGWANGQHGAGAALKAGLAQGSYAFASTFMVTSLALALLARFGASWHGALASFLLTCLVMLAIPASIHTLLATPELLRSILPGAVWGSGYVAAVLWLEIRRLPHRQPAVID